ncbi:unnamed protein product [Cuscuta epithymum]|uniref:Retrovirus-related Pol polyprotein from transposon TNT 1-94-like beta-barrel domain-containing protein n=1 Tax=Cuscuta epithymum TaxID=186058 RepID=A0AAV0CM90_9ASTE|nr:unnamed protein product [Cuscuta epithymum]
MEMNNEVELTLLMANHEEQTKKSMWYLDTGASNHMTRDKSLFVKVEQDQGHVTFEDEYKVVVNGAAHYPLANKPPRPNPGAARRERAAKRTSNQQRRSALLALAREVPMMIQGPRRRSLLGRAEPRPCAYLAPESEDQGTLVQTHWREIKLLAGNTFNAIDLVFGKLATHQPPHHQHQLPLGSINSNIYFIVNG